MTLSIFAASSLAPRFVGRFGARSVITTGMLSATAGMVLLTGVAPGGTYLRTVLAGGLLSAIGMGFSLVPATIVAMQGLDGSQSGLGSGLLNTSRLMGGALGLAVLSTIAASHTRGALGVSPARALTDGFGLAFGVGALFCIAGAAVAAFLLAPRARVSMAGAATSPAHRSRWRWAGGRLRSGPEAGSHDASEPVAAMTAASGLRADGDSCARRRHVVGDARPAGSAPPVRRPGR